MKKLLLFAFLPFCSVMMANAQQTNIASQKITGKVKESATKNAEFVSVSLLRSKDSSSVKGMTTTENGQYEFLNVNNGSYLIVVNGVGIKPAYSKAFTLDGSVSEFKVADIYLTTTTKSLKEVTVVGTKPFVEQKLDKMVLNVENSVLAAGETAMEVLEKAPGITVDKDDNLSLKGKEGVIVMVDGKPTSLSSTELGAMLRNMPSNNIAQIEVITNPSAKYDAAGNSGIINIKTKKNKQVGLNGSLTTGLGYSQFSKYNGGLNLNYRNNKFNFFGNYNYGYNPRTQILNLERIVTKEQVTIFNQLSDGKRKNYNNTFKVGVDYFINKNNTLGFMVNGFTNTRKSTDLNNTKIMNQDYLLDSALNVTSLSERNSNNFAYNFNYKSTLDTSGQELTVDFDYSKFEGLSEDNRDNFYLKANAEELRTPKFIQNVAPTDIDIKSVKVDYTLPLNKNSKLEAGIKSSFAKTDNDYKFYRSINKQEWISDLGITNHFIYKENINAAYLNYNTNLGKTSIQLGLRAEQTSSNGNSITKNQVVDTSYTQLFPSVFISQKLSKKHEMGLTYSRRIDRPDYEDLNPFLNFLDEYTYQQGNPYLRPQFTNSFELSHTYNGKLTTTLGYSHIKDVMITITEQNDTTKTTKAIEKNLNSQVSYSFGISTPLNITKWWSSVNNFQSFYLGFKDGDDLDAGEIAFQFNTNHNFTLPDGYRAELSAQYQSPLAYGIFKVEAKYRLDAGIQKSFLNKKASLKLSVSDILNTQRERISTTYQNMNLHLDQRRDSRQAKLTLTYRFGKTDFKPRQRKSGSEDEQSRIKSGS